MQLLIHLLQYLYTYNAITFIQTQAFCMYNAKLYIKYRYLITYNPLISNFKSILYATNYKIYPLVTISFKIVPQSILVALFSSVNDKHSHLQKNSIHIWYTLTLPTINSNSIDILNTIRTNTDYFIYH